jgi:hypothetical protein
VLCINYVPRDYNLDIILDIVVMKFISVLLLLFTSAVSFHKKPIILLDVDSVINLNSGSRKWNDIKKASVKSPSGLHNFRIEYSQLMVKNINDWKTLSEIRWLTKWNEHVKTNLAPVIGLEEFEMARTSDQHEEKVQTVNRIINEIDDDRLIIWIDDSIKWQDNQDDIKKIEERPNTVLISPDWGLTPKEIKFIDKCLANPQGWKSKMLQEY